jgi:uncharacterized protein (DUF58 family)
MQPQKRQEHPPIRWWQSLLVTVALATAFSMAIAAGQVSAPLLRASLAAGALLLVIIMAVTTVPALFRRTALRNWLSVPIEFRFTAAGLPFLLTLLVLAVAAINSGNNLVYLVVASLLAALLTSGFLSALNLSGMALHFHFPDHLFAGQETPVQLTLENEKAIFPGYSLTVSAGSRSSDDHLARGRRLRRRGRKAAEGEIQMRAAYFPYVPRRQSIAATSYIVFPRRGEYEPAAFTLSTRFPFMLIDKRRKFASDEQQTPILVYPSVAAEIPFANDLLARSGEIEYDQRGQGHDLYQVRPHQIGDSARSVHWKASAKMGSLLVREFSREEERRVRIYFGLAGVGSEEAERAIAICASLVWQLARTDTWIEFIGCNPTTGRRPTDTRSEPEVFEPGMQAARDCLHQVLRYLALADPAGGVLPLPGRAEGAFQIAFVGNDGAAARGSIRTFDSASLALMASAANPV